MIFLTVIKHSYIQDGFVLCEIQLAVIRILPLLYWNEYEALTCYIRPDWKYQDNNVLFLQGIYRVSGVKSTVENLCQKFESDPESVNLDSENPNVISNVLKLYLRQLPEPLLTFKLYQNFIQVAKVFALLTL